MSFVQVFINNFVYAQEQYYFGNSLIVYRKKSCAKVRLVNHKFEIDYLMYLRIVP